jgi:hypothetical protein
VPQRIAEVIHKHFNPRHIVYLAFLTAYCMAVASPAISLGMPIEGA